MAEDSQYASNTDYTTTSTKRKYEEQTTPPPPRCASGFSAPIFTSSSQDLTAVPPPSYNSVPPPVDEIQLAKQRAQEIAARIFSQAASVEAKRPRVENGAGGYDSGGDKGFTSYSSDFSQKPKISSNALQTPYSYGGSFHDSKKKMEIPNGRVGVIIGKGGETIKHLQAQSGAKIQVARDSEVDPNSLTRAIELTGTQEAVDKAEQLINEVLSEAEIGGSGSASRRMSGQSGSGDQFVMKIATNKVGLVIGKGGETIKNMQAKSGARIQVIPLHPPPGDTSTERTIQIDGTSDQIESAKQLISEVTSENRPRNSSMGGGGGGYSQQGYQARPTTNWSQQGPPMQQQYGYVQPGAYSGTTPQYQQQAYNGGYPSQQNSGGYANWDQNSAPSSQQTTQGSGYDYYNQQSGTQQPGAPASADNNTGYNYNQQQPTSGYNQQGQGYSSQDGYGSAYNQAPGSQSSYNQVQPQGYDQQGYNNSAQAYANVTNPTIERLTSSDGAQGDNSTQTPPPVQPSTATGQQGYTASPNPGGYPSQPGYYGYGTGGYGVPPTGYGQPSPVQASYQHYQPNYVQPNSAAQGVPTTPGATAPQPGYGAPSPYSAQGYGQQQPSSYSNSYGSGYVQPAAYAADPADSAAGGGAQTGAPKAVSPTS